MLQYSIALAAYSDRPGCRLQRCVLWKNGARLSCGLYRKKTIKNVGSTLQLLLFRPKTVHPIGKRQLGIEIAAKRCKTEQMFVRKCNKKPWVDFHMI